MRDNQQEPTFEFQDWFDGGDIFYRSKDKQRMQQALKAMVDEDLGLAVIGTNETVLDHYCRMLVARLRDLNIFQVEVLLPTNTDSLLKRFNEMLAAMSMEQARQPAEPDAPVKLLVVNDAKAVDEEQWSLLVRLLSDFPGIKVRLVLFINKTGWPSYEKPLGLFGRKLYRWVAETPTLEEATQLMKAAVEHGSESETETLLMHTGLGAAISGGYADEDPDTSSSIEDGEKSDYLTEDFAEDSPFPQQAVEFLDDEILADEENDQPRKGLDKNWWLVVAFLLSLAITWALMSLVNLEDFDSTISAPSVETNSSTQPAVGQSLSPLSEATLPDEMLPKEPSQADRAAALVKALRNEQEQTSKASSPAVKQIPAEEPAAELKPKLLSAQQKAIAAVKRARTTDWFVQHIVLSEEAQATRYKQRYAGLGSAMVVPIKTSGSLAYAVISGPFLTRDQAERFAKGRDRPADYWIRGSAPLEAALGDN